MGDEAVEAAFAPEADVGEVDGKAVVVASVECRGGCVIVDLNGRANDVTRRLDARYEQELSAWAPRVLAARAQGERGPDPPEQPGSFMNDLPLALSDDVGTTYRALRKQAAGSGTEWQGRWTFEPAPPRTARSLTVGLDTPGGRSHTLPL